MTAVTPARDDAARYRIEPTVLQALRSPRLLTREVLAGLVVAIALIPEAIAFSIIAGVDPRLGLFSSFVMAVAISFLGGRPAMITAATGAVALVIAPVAREHGIDYFIATVILAGILQVVFAVLGVAKLMRFIPRSVMVGFVNALAILIFIAQVPHLIGVPWAVYPLTAAGLLILFLMPRLTKVVPAPLVTIVVVTAAALLLGISVPTVGDQGALPESLPSLFIPQVPLTGETLGIILPYAAAMAVVGLLESLMTAKLVDDITDTHSRKTREAWGQGAANVLSGMFGGMGGCAMIGQTMINVKASGARTRISTFLAGTFLLVLVLVFGDVVAVIPMAALVAVMVVVCIATFDWHSIRFATLRRMPRSETAVMVLTVVATVWTHNLAIGVGVGVVAAMVLFARRVAHLTRVTRRVDGETARYTVDGELFFASSNDLTTQFDYSRDPDEVVVDFSRSHVWDASTVAALDAIEAKYARLGKRVRFTGMNAETSDFHGRLSGGLGSGA
ncbi:SulP family inorganic anion transporter [Microbacterium sp. EYE_5]|uniref:SulP family inorganic anion transporter n=1 Tax=unclassified Microbacterium TaxID=2609290 RepID=UPI002005FAFB|nr:MULTISPECIES: SulP family inorganic anion transporter [unclassified Microbacterium]MCK6080359.1 SulP family inorganic anion transporter [Microbacterium sp. EYE_382]MCK6085630.1 SulP family inorganic anion transporter [Microbacterium sp. EYE_384]MCK6122145.1 SulP family inorganic anion transporter [Microbacterium sp. EYE_80]MCK6126393.1 SulP family inorganic anion transporter [Microbacterium sp. EYE_79]MCK6141314.1 SulP family inorganic anion transporter [Microbacterium sp. EYE_39]